MRVLVLALLLAIPVGCIEGSTEGSETGAAEVVLTPNRTEFADRINITVELVVHETFTYRSRGGSPPLHVEVNVTDGPAIKLYGYADNNDPEREISGISVIHDVTLEPGTYYRRTVSWNGHREPLGANPHTGERLPPGLYKIRAMLGSVDDQPQAETSVTLSPR